MTGQVDRYQAVFGAERSLQLLLPNPGRRRVAMHEQDRTSGTRALEARNRLRADLKMDWS